MEAEFWIKAWNEGRTGFHEEKTHPKLLQYFNQLNSQNGDKILVPLCGKSKDLLWLHQRGLSVHGIELHENAVISFFQENHLTPVKQTVAHDFVNYSFENILISCGDFFNLQGQEYDFVYDRASLVALPQEMRKKYAEVIRHSVKLDGKYLLVVYEYDQTKLDGPPFSVSEKEIRELYQNDFEIQLLENSGSENEKTRLSSVEGLVQKVYLLEKTTSSLRET